MCMQTLQDVVNHLQELCNKKDKYIQSTKMIIKFRENHIQSLQQASKGYTEMEKDMLVVSLTLIFFFTKINFKYGKAFHI